MWNWKRYLGCRISNVFENQVLLFGRNKRTEIDTKKRTVCVLKGDRMLAFF